MSSHTMLIYLAAAFGLSVTPGPNSLLVLSHGALYGHWRTLFTIAGGAAGFTVLIAVSMAGIGALLHAVAGALVVLKLLGGAYLIWLGVRIWRAPAIDPRPVASGAGITRTGAARRGFLTAVSNPKGLLFYGAFLPQFIDPARDLLGQFVLLASIFVAVEIVVELLLAVLAHRVRAWLSRLGRRFNRACGGLFVAFGAGLPVSG